MEFPEAYRCFDEGHQWACASTHDGRAICGRCGYAEPVTHDECEHDEGDRAEQNAEFEDGIACLNCGMCEWCIERSIAAAEEVEPAECSMCPAFIWAEESVRTGKCHGCRSPGPQVVVV